MANNLEYIDNYFKKELSPEQCSLFEQRIETDQAFAEDVAFYISTKQAVEGQLVEEKKERFRAVYDYPKQVRASYAVKRLRLYVSAVAAVAVIVLGIYLFNKPKSAQELADNFIKENFQELGVTMDAGMDSIKIGKEFFNEGKLDSAKIYFESVLMRDTSLFEVAEYAGITCLRLKQYDRAIDHFSKMERVVGLYSNPGMFYHAVALMQRNKPGDTEEAKKLLSKVADNNLTGNDKAKEWLNRL